MREKKNMCSFSLKKISQYVRKDVKVSFLALKGFFVLVCIMAVNSKTFKMTLFRNILFQDGPIGHISRGP